MTRNRFPRGAAAGLGAALLLLAGAPAIAQDAQESPRYGDTPEELVPYRGAGQPYSVFFVDPPQFRGPGREDPEPASVDEVRLGVLVPTEGAYEARGTSMRRGVELALEEANATGGFRGAPFVPLYRNESQAWGAAANAAVELAFDQRVWALIGGLEDEASHVLTRVLLKIEVPLVNTAGTDPTLTEHAIPWMVRMRPDDRQAGYRLAHKVFEEDGHRRVAVFRGNNRYARVGVGEFVDAARRLHRPIILEVRFEDFDTSYEAQLGRLRDLEPDAVVMWGRGAPTGRALAALRAVGMEQPVYGPDGMTDGEFLAAAGPAADGLVVSYPFDPGSSDPRWQGFLRRYRAHHGSSPDLVAAYAYDGTWLLVRAIREAGLNRVLIRDRLFAHQTDRGVTGTIHFDSTHNNIDHVHLARVEDGVLHLLPEGGP